MKGGFYNQKITPFQATVTNNQQLKKGNFAYGRKAVVYESRGRSKGTGGFRFPRLQNYEKIECRAESKRVYDHRRKGQPQIFYGKVLLQRNGKEVIKWQFIKKKKQALGE